VSFGVGVACVCICVLCGEERRGGQRGKGGLSKVKSPAPLQLCSLVSAWPVCVCVTCVCMCVRKEGRGGGGGGGGGGGKSPAPREVGLFVYQLVVGVWGEVFCVTGGGGGGSNTVMVRSQSACPIRSVEKKDRRESGG